MRALLNRPRGVVRRYDLEIAQGEDLDALGREVCIERCPAQFGEGAEVDAALRERIRQTAIEDRKYVDDLEPLERSKEREAATVAGVVVGLRRAAAHLREQSNKSLPELNTDSTAQSLLLEAADRVNRGLLRGYANSIDSMASDYEKGGPSVSHDLVSSYPFAMREVEKLVQRKEIESLSDEVASMRAREVSTGRQLAELKALRRCTRCGARYDAHGSCSNKPCQGGVGEWNLEHHEQRQAEEHRRQQLDRDRDAVTIANLRSDRDDKQKALSDYADSTDQVADAMSKWLKELDGVAYEVQRHGLAEGLSLLQGSVDRRYALAAKMREHLSTMLVEGTRVVEGIVVVARDEATHDKLPSRVTELAEVVVVGSCVTKDWKGDAKASRAFVDPMGRTLRATGRFQKGPAGLYPREFEILAVADIKPEPSPESRLYVTPDGQHLRTTGKMLVHDGVEFEHVVPTDASMKEPAAAALRAARDAPKTTGVSVVAIMGDRNAVDAPPAPSASLSSRKEQHEVPQAPLGGHTGSCASVNGGDACDCGFVPF